MLLAYVTYQNAIEESSLQVLVSKIKFSGKVYIFLDFLFWKFILIFRYYPTVL